MRSIVITICISLLLATFAQGRTISSRKPDGLAVSTGNLYFTSHDAAGAAVWRTSQTSVPGQESILYWEAGARFGDIVFAQVNGNFFGYFFAEKSGVITIRRVSLTGGTARVLATMTNVDVVNSRRNLVTDGRFLYWQDDGAIRKMPIGGGASIVLDKTRLNTPTAGIVLNNGRIIYASVDDIRFVPTVGAITDPSVRTIAKTSSRVTVLHVGISGVYWSEQNGAFRLKSGATIRTLGATSPTPTSISTKGTLVVNGVTSDAELAITDCDSQECKLRKFDFRSDGTFEIVSFEIGDDAFGITLTPSASVFWGDADGVHTHIV